MTAPDPTAARLDEIEARLAAAPAGTWYVDDEEQTVRVETYAGEIVYDQSGENRSEWLKEFRSTAEFIAAAPADVAYLLTELRKRDAKLEAVRAACDRVIDNADGHKPPGPPHPTREQGAAIRIRAALGDGDE